MSTFWDKCTIKGKLLIGVGAILLVFTISSLVVSAKPGVTKVAVATHVDADGDGSGWNTF